MLVEVFTCGLAVSAHGVSSLPSAITESCAGREGVKFIFSFHGATAQTHDYITRTPGSYECLLSSLKCCQQVGIECELNFVPLRVNIHEFDKLIDIAQGLQIPRISVLRFVPQGRGALNRAELEPNPEEESSFVSEVVRLREATNVEIRTGSPYNGIIFGNQVPCRAGFGKLVVQADGNVLPCEVFKHDKRRQWDLSVYDMTLTQIVESPQVSNLYERLRYTNCLECPVHGALRNTQEVEVIDALSAVSTRAK
jgi:radical SAM protein with 4Fe4S-binding SPASM domain